MTMEWTLPYPPTVNTYWRHVVMTQKTKSGKTVHVARVLISKEGRRYRELIKAMVTPDECLAGGVGVHVEMTPPDRRERDLDNLFKALFDALAHAGCYKKDAQIVEMHAFKRQPVPPGCVTVRLWPVEEPTDD